MSVYDKNLYYAKLGDPLAQNAIIHGCGSMVQYNTDYANEGYPKDMSVAHFWADKLKASAASGNTLAQYEISTTRLDLDNIVERLLTNETKEELINLQNKYKKLIEEKVKNNDPYAIFAVAEDKNDLEMLKKAAELGCSLACETLQRYYCLGGFDGNIDFSKSQPSKQFTYSQKGAFINDFYSCRCQYHLADCYREGIGVQRDANKYISWLTKAAENGCYEAIEKKKRLPSNANGTNASQSGGCYVATCVYGSYDCPQVWTLRRFRDYRLMNSLPGRIFVKLYYYVSPKIVKKYGTKRWFNSFLKLVLDKFVSSLNRSGYDDSKYND